jgi:hypothetical protein
MGQPCFGGESVKLAVCGRVLGGDRLCTLCFASEILGFLRGPRAHASCGTSERQFVCTMPDRTIGPTFPWKKKLAFVLST